MIISLQHRFVFVANTKAASTTIENLLRPHVDVCLSSEPKLKHMPLARIHQVFEPIFQMSEHQLADFASFGVLRDPTEWVVSWFNYLSRPKSKIRQGPRYVGDVEFGDFCRVVAESADTPDRPAWATLGGQLRRFSLGDEIGLNVIVDHARLSSGFAELSELIGRDLSEDLQTRRENVSKNVRLRIEDVTDAQRALLFERFRSDYELYAAVSEGPQGLHWANPLP